MAVRRGGGGGGGVAGGGGRGSWTFCDNLKQGTVGCL